MTTAPILIVNLPETAGTALHWWLVEDGEVIGRGCDADPLLAADLKLPAVADQHLHQIALIPSAATVVRWHERIAEGTDQQALAAARVEASEQSLGGDNLHIVTDLTAEGQVVSASIAASLLASGLAALQEAGIDPNQILPVGMLVPEIDQGAVSVDLGFDRVVCAPDFIAPDEPALRAMLDTEPQPLDDAQGDQMLANAASSSALDFRTGVFAKKLNRRMSGSQRSLLIWLAVAALLLSLLIPVAQLIRYNWATAELEDEALAAAVPVVGEVENLEQAERLLDDQLIRENRGNVIFSVPASALFSALQQAPGVSAERIGYRPDGTLFAGLTAVRNEDINPVLLSLQQNGYVITATPRTDATGAAKADITVRVR